MTRPLPPLPLASLLAALSLLLPQPRPVGGVWELEQLWVEDIREYVEKYTGDLDDAGTAIDSKFLRFEQTGWYQKLYDRTSVGMDKVRDARARERVHTKIHTARERERKRDARRSLPPPPSG